jgi:hypothetical protein
MRVHKFQYTLTYEGKSLLVICSFPFRAGSLLIMSWNKINMDKPEKSDVASKYWLSEWWINHSTEFPIVLQKHSMLPKNYPYQVASFSHITEQVNCLCITGSPIYLGIHPAAFTCYCTVNRLNSRLRLATHMGSSSHSN